jgi:chemotaxis signal transduction protein
VSEAAQSGQKRNFVLFPMGKKRFALSADAVTELARPDRLHTFPHTTPLLSGVLWRRGQIVPVCDVAPVLIGPEAPERKFYLITARRGESSSEWTALPVTGECELASSELLPLTDKLPEHVCGLIALGDEIVEVIDLERAIAREGNA